jgi:hypothetical protein
MQAMGNTYYAYTHLANFQGWIELFGLTEEDLIYQKRVLSIVSGAILPIVALGFIKSLVDYIKPTDEATQTESEDKIEAILEEKIEETIDNKVEELEEKIEDLEEKMEEIVDGGDSNESEIIPENITEPVGEILESLNIGRYNTAVEVDPTKIN